MSNQPSDSSDSLTTPASPAHAAFQISEPTTTASGTQPGQALYDPPPAGSQPIELTRSQRARTPSKHGRESNEYLRARALRRQTRVAGQQSLAPSGTGTSITEDDDDDSEEGAVVPTSDPHELEDEYTYQSELENTQFREKLTSDIKHLLKGEYRGASKTTLKALLKVARGDQASPLAASQQQTKVIVLPAKELDGGGGHHLTYKSQLANPSKKRRFSTPSPGPSKRGRLATKGPSDTEPEDFTPLPVAKLAFPPPAPFRPASLPQGTAGPSTLLRPSSLPASNTAPSFTQLMRRTNPFNPSRVARNRAPTVPALSQTRPEPSVPERPSAPHHISSTWPDLATPQDSQPRSQPRPPASAQDHASSTDIVLDQANPPHTAPTQSGSSRPPLPPSVHQPDQLAELRHRFDSNARNRARAQAVIRGRANESVVPSHPSLDYDELMEDDTEELAAAKDADSGKPAQRKPKPGLNVQPGRPRQIATSAVLDATAEAFSHDPFATRSTTVVVVLESYDRRWEAELPNHPYEAPVPALIDAIADRVPGGRTVVKSNIRPVIKRRYDFISPAMTEEDIEHNIEIYHKIREDFHMSLLAKRDGHYEHPALKEAFVEGLFPTSYAPCAVHHRKFTPAAPVVTIAFVLTMMQACIDEWRTGQCEHEHLNASQQSDMYKIHLANLDVFAGMAPERLYRIRKECYEAGVRNALRVRDINPSTRATICREEIRPDTPPPEANNQSQVD